MVRPRRTSPRHQRIARHLSSVNLQRVTIVSIQLNIPALPTWIDPVVNAALYDEVILND